MRPVHPLVPEDAREFIDAIEPADEQLLERKLERDPEEERHVERVVVRHERTRHRPAIDRLEHRRLHLEESARIERLPERPDHVRARLEDASCLRIEHQVQVATTVPLARVLPRVEDLSLLLLHHRQRPDRLGEEVERLHRDRRLTGAGSDARAANADDVTQVEELEDLVGVFADVVLLEVELDLLAGILDVRERRLPHRTKREDPTGDRHRLPGSFSSFEPLQHLSRGVGSVEAVRVRLDTELPQPRDLVDTGLDQFRSHSDSSGRRSDSADLAF